MERKFDQQQMMEELLQNVSEFECHDSASQHFDGCADALSRVFNESKGKELEAALLVHSPQRRSLLVLVERFIHLKSWHQKRLPTHPIMLQIARALFSIAGRIQFTEEKNWFGGLSSAKSFSLDCSSPTNQLAKRSSDSRQLRLNSIAYFSIGIILIQQLQVEDADAALPLEQMEVFFQRLQSTFPSSNSFMDALLENDERCLATMAALLKLNRPGSPQTLVPLCAMLNPDMLLLLLLRKINFDALVLIDWVASEPELAFVFMKSFTHHLAQYSAKEIFGICESFCQLRPEGIESSWNVARADPDPGAAAPSSSSHFHFEFEELHGEQPMLRRVRVPTDGCALQLANANVPPKHSQSLLPPLIPSFRTAAAARPLSHVLPQQIGIALCEFTDETGQTLGIASLSLKNNL